MRASADQLKQVHVLFADFAASRTLKLLDPKSKDLMRELLNRVDASS